MKKQNSLALIVAYYLSKYDRIAYKSLGYDSLTKAHTEIGRTLNVNPNSVKNMRDEFDPIHNNQRVGWYQRELRPSRQKVIELFQRLSEEELRDVALEILNNPYFSNSDEGSEIVSSLERKTSKREKSKVFIPRGSTGKKAEEYFINYHRDSGQPVIGHLKDTRDLGCGYDFEIHNKKNTFYIEVKGLDSTDGGVSFTSKEWDVARKFGQRYFLVVIRNVSSEPKFQIVQNPVCKLDANKNIYATVQVQWNVSNSQLKEIE